MLKNTLTKSIRTTDGSHASWKDFKGTGIVLCAFGLIGAGCLAAQSRVPLPEASLMAFASMAVGIAFGFLLGTPPGAGNADATQGTHLEQISDWLTKILVGAGLVQLEKVPAALQGMAATVRASDGLAAAAIVSILVSFLVLGFFIGYLATRLFLAGAFGRAETITEQRPDSPVPNVPGPNADTQIAAKTDAQPGADGIPELAGTPSTDGASGAPTESAPDAPGAMKNTLQAAGAQ